MFNQLSDRNIVLGLGNTLNRDEGLGVHALKKLEAALDLRYPAWREEKGTGLEILDGGTLGLNLLPLVEESSHLLLLDAVNAGKPAGTLVELAKESIPLFNGIKLSDHQVTFSEVLGLASFRGKLPEYIHLIGIQPVDMAIGVDISPEIEALMPEIVERAIIILQEWNLLPKE